MSDATYRRCLRNGSLIHIDSHGILRSGERALATTREQLDALIEELSELRDRMEARVLG